MTIYTGSDSRTGWLIGRRAIASRPKLLLLDEPAAGLSAEEIRRLGALIKAISRHGVAVLLVEHHADLIFAICDRVTVLNLGKELAAGTPAEIRLLGSIGHPAPGVKIRTR